jgi:sensor domain CHASE-containing protein
MSVEWLSNPWFYLVVLAIAAIIIYAIVSWQDEMEKKADRQKLEERLKRLEAQEAEKREKQ